MPQDRASLVHAIFPHPLFALALLALALVSCVSPGRYTSLDLAVLPCELGEAPDFFLPIEFTADGTYPQQKDTVFADLRRGEFADLIFFLRGWNKSPASAELDYQNFICRFHGKLDASLTTLIADLLYGKETREILRRPAPIDAQCQ